MDPEQAPQQRTVAAGVDAGAAILRVHDVAAVADFLAVRAALRVNLTKAGMDVTLCTRAEEAIETLKLPALLDQPGVELSGGEQRRAEVALAWIREPRCLLADEPFAGINPSDGELIAGALRGLAERGCAILVTGHEVRQLLDLADEVIWMAGGTTHGLGSPVAAVENHQFRREYLGMMTR